MGQHCVTAAVVRSSKCNIFTTLANGLAMTRTEEVVGFIGVGLMGHGMAKNIMSQA